MPAAHYAISEIAIVLASVFAIHRLAPRGFWLASFAILLIGAVAALGAWRFASGQFDALETLHLTAAVQGGLVAMMFLSADMAMKARAQQSTRLAVVGLFMASLLATSSSPSLVPVFSLAWLVVALIVMAIYAQADRFLAVSSMSIMLIGLLVVRQNSYLDAAVSFHLYHLMIACWLALLPFCLSRLPKRVKAAPIQG